MRWGAAVAVLVVACSSNGASTDGGVEGGADAGPIEAGVGDPLITYDSLTAAYEALQAGALDVPVSVEGRERYVRALDASGDETDTLFLDGYVIYRAAHTGSTSHVEQDQNGDGKMDWSSDVTRGATDDDRQAIILSDPAGTGSPTSRTTMTQTAATPDTVHVKVEGYFSGAWITERELDTPVVEAVDPAVLVDTSSCDPLSPAIQSGMEQAITDGVAQMQHYGAKDIVNGITALIAERGVRVVCDPDVYNLRKDCAEASIFDSLSHSRLSGVFGSRVTINVAPASACIKPSAFFHELLHIVTGAWHAQPITPTDKEWKADDRVYSCTDVAFQADNNTAPTTQCECATCLKTTMDDPRCALFDKCPADIVITSATCTPAGPCDCLATTGNLDVIDVEGTAHGPPGSIAAVPDITGDWAIDCGGWANVKTVVFGAATGCQRDPDAHSKISWSTKGNAQTICQCNPAGVPQPIQVGLEYGLSILATDGVQLNCP